MGILCKNIREILGEIKELFTPITTCTIFTCIHIYTIYKTREGGCGGGGGGGWTGDEVFLYTLYLGIYMYVV